MTLNLVVPSLGDITDPDTIQQIFDDLTSLRTDVDSHSTYLPIHTFKSSAGTAFPSTTTLADETNFFVAGAANRVYFVKAVVFYVAGQTADLKLAWTFPSSGSGQRLDYAAHGIDSAATIALQETASAGEASASSKTFGGANISLTRYVDYQMRWAVGTVAGNLQLQRAQSVSTAENTAIGAGSFIVATRVA
jgi:hypothetical protein